MEAQRDDFSQKKGENGGGRSDFSVQTVGNRKECKIKQVK